MISNRSLTGQLSLVRLLLLHGDSNKVAAVESVLSLTRLNYAQVCRVGDDVVDVVALKRAGVAVADAADEATAVAHYATKAAGEVARARGGRNVDFESTEQMEAHRF